MAKISARGDVEAARWTHRERKTVYLLTRSGRLLWKSGLAGDGYKLRRRYKKDRIADVIAALGKALESEGYDGFRNPLA
jgi:hypothetical protein